MSVTTTVTKAEVNAFSARLRKWYSLFTLGFIAFVLVMLFLETNFGLPRVAIGYAFLLLTLGMYGVIGVLNFTRKLDEYYVAGRKVPPFFNGMATGADWMSAASFISMAGTIWLLGYDGPDGIEAANASYYDSPERAALDPNPARHIAEARQLPVRALDL